MHHRHPEGLRGKICRRLMMILNFIPRGMTEVSDFEVAHAEDDVRRLQIMVDQVVAVNKGQTVGQIPN